MNSGSRNQGGCGGVGLIILLIILGVSYCRDNKGKPGKPYNHAERNYEKRQSFVQPEQPRPSSGLYENFAARTCAAPLRIETTSGDGDYFVKLVDQLGGGSVLTVYVRDGSSVSLTVPLGTFEIRYACGKKWFGTRYLFGPETGYSKADKLFKFEETPEGYSGYTVKLIRVPYGNLRTSQIGADGF